MRDGEKDDVKREIHGRENRRVEGSNTRSNVAKTGEDDNAKNRNDERGRKTSG